MNFQKDFYAVLEVDKNAGTIEIKKAYRSLSKKYHPDLNPGNLEYEEISKLLNEAYGVLGNPEKKFIYDQYRNSRQDNPNLKKEETPDDPRPKHKRTYTKKSVVTIKKDVYVVGKIVFKYYGYQDNVLSQNINDLFFSIRPTEVSALVKEKDIFKSGELPPEIEAIFTTNRPAPYHLNNTRTEIIYDDHTEFYQLNLRDPIILDPTISDVTKHEGISYGTLTGTFYSVFEHSEEQEIEELVEECFGETGRKDENADESNTYSRVEYYNSDCTTYWGPWVAEPISKPSYSSQSWDSSASGSSGSSSWSDRSGGSGSSFKFWKAGFRRWTQSRTPNGQYSSGGCGVIPMIFVGGFLLWSLFRLWHPITWLIGLIILLLMLRNTGWFLNLVLRLGGALFALVALFAIWGAIKHPVTVVQTDPIVDGREATKIKPDVSGRTNPENEPDKQDQIISHNRVWNDYSGNNYEGEMKIFVSDYQSAQQDHQSMNFQLSSEADWSPVYYNLLKNDQDRLEMLYTMFDSIQTSRKLDRVKFAEMVVSCIQDIPYYLVLPENCSSHEHGDPFVQNFINNKPGYCLGNVSYGVQSPAEFLGNLKGDCDTRVAMLFAIFNHYQYKVAILGSSQFRHSVLGLELPGEGLSKNYRGIDYKLWETTSAGFRPGDLAAEVSDLNYWNFYLTN